MSKVLNNSIKVRLFFLNHSPVDIELKNIFEIVRSICWQGGGQRLTRVEDLDGNDISKQVKSQINTQFRDWIKS